MSGLISFPNRDARDICSSEASKPSGRIVILCHSSLWGGLESHAELLARTIASRGQECIIGCLDDKTYELFHRVKAPRLRVMRIAGTASVEARTFLQWLRAFREIGGDACIFEKGTLNSGSLRLELAARMTFRRFVTIEQVEPFAISAIPSRRYLFGLLPGFGMWRWGHWWRGHLRSLVPQKVVAVSQSTTNLLCSDYGFPVRKVVTIHNGADTDLFVIDNVARQEARRAWDACDDTIVFGTARRLCRDKGIDLAIEAFSMYRREHTERKALLVIYGEGPQRGELEELVHVRGVDKETRFCGFSSNLASVYPGFDAFLMPSRTEALSLSLCEAMSCGVVPIASNAGGSVEVVETRELGWIIPRNDIGSLYRAIVELASLSNGERERRRSIVRQQIVEKFDANSQIDAIINLVGSS